LIALAKSKPGQLTFATPGAGSAPHLSAELFKRMAGIDMIHVPLRQSPGGEADCLRYSVCPCFQAGYAYEIRCETGMPIVAVGMISTAQHAEALLREGHADLIALARGLMDDPNWPLHAARELGVADPLALVHPREAQRLRQLEHHHRDYPPGSAIEIPFAPEERAAYSWEAGIAGDRSTAEYDARDCSCIDLIDFPALRSPRDAGFFIAGSQPAHALPARPQRAACPKAVPFAVAPRCQVSDPGLCF
ncbi:MAG: tripartite tricarboxylate transporter substrate-binding protein, partial [Burkholderiales bacterium]